MAIYHIVLFRLKPVYEKAVLEYWKQQVNGLVGIVPGLRYVDVGAPLPVTANKAHGFNLSLVAVLEKPEDALVYAEHPAHEKIIQECRPQLFEDVLVCDMEFQEQPRVK